MIQSWIICVLKW
uniref:Uncharacterized protein n=1 Tax=Lepeophtheirus salmonis TaxID=72036 RepID=A0A0K2U5I5_LEPSM